MYRQYVYYKCVFSLIKRLRCKNQSESAIDAKCPSRRLEAATYFGVATVSSGS